MPRNGWRMERRRGKDREGDKLLEPNVDEVMSAEFQNENYLLEKVKSRF